MSVTRLQVYSTHSRTSTLAPNTRVYACQHCPLRMHAGMVIFHAYGSTIAVLALVIGGGAVLTISMLLSMDCTE